MTLTIILMTHIKCIGNSYIGVVSRFNVPQEYTSWKKQFPTYSPVNYNDPSFPLSQATSLG